MEALKYESEEKPRKIKCNDSKVHAVNLISSKLLSVGQAWSDLSKQIKLSKTRL